SRGFPALRGGRDRCLRRRPADRRTLRRRACAVDQADLRKRRAGLHVGPLRRGGRRGGVVSRRRLFDLARPSRQHWLGYILLTPAVILIALIIVYPLFVSLDLSFQKVGLARIGAPRKAFTLDNYERLFSSPDFW